MKRIIIIILFFVIFLLLYKIFHSNEKFQVSGSGDDYNKYYYSPVVKTNNSVEDACPQSNNNLNKYLTYVDNDKISDNNIKYNSVIDDNYCKTQCVSNKECVSFDIRKVDYDLGTYHKCNFYNYLDKDKTTNFNVINNTYESDYWIDSKCYKKNTNFMTKQQRDFEDTNFEFVKNNYCNDFGASKDDNTNLEQLTGLYPAESAEINENTSRVENCAKACYDNNNCVALTYSRMDGETRCFMYKLKEGKTTFEFKNPDEDPGYGFDEEQISRGDYNQCFRKIKFKKITTQNPFTTPDIENFRTVGTGKCIPYKYETQPSKDINDLSSITTGLGNKTHLLQTIPGTTNHKECGKKCENDIKCHAFNCGTTGCVLYKNIDFLSDKTVYSDGNRFDNNKDSSNNTACYIKNVLNPLSTINQSCNLSYIDFIGSDNKFCNENKKKIKTTNSVKITKDTKYDSYLIV